MTYLMHYPKHVRKGFVKRHPILKLAAVTAMAVVAVLMITVVALFIIAAAVLTQINA